MEDRRAQIPTMCCVNVAIIDRLSQSTEFVQKCKEVPVEFGFGPPKCGDPWPFMNPSWAAYIMYCLLVVPKELYQLPKNDSFYTDLQEKDVFNSFVIKRQKRAFSDDPRYHFSSIRNAISHVNYQIDQNTFKFWDHPPRKPNERHWEVSITEADLIAFLCKLADALNRLYAEFRAGKRSLPKMLYIDNKRIKIDSLIARDLSAALDITEEACLRRTLTLHGRGHYESPWRASRIWGGWVSGCSSLSLMAPVVVRLSGSRSSASSSVGSRAVSFLSASSTFRAYPPSMLRRIARLLISSVTRFGRTLIQRQLSTKTKHHTKHKRNSHRKDFYQICRGQIIKAL